MEATEQASCKSSIPLGIGMLRRYSVVWTNHKEKAPRLLNRDAQEQNAQPFDAFRAQSSALADIGTTSLTSMTGVILTSFQ